MLNTMHIQYWSYMYITVSDIVRRGYLIFRAKYYLTLFTGSWRVRYGQVEAAITFQWWRMMHYSNGNITWKNYLTIMFKSWSFWEVKHRGMCWIKEQKLLLKHLIIRAVSNCVLQQELIVSENNFSTCKGQQEAVALWMMDGCRTLTLLGGVGIPQPPPHYFKDTGFVDINNILIALLASSVKFWIYM